MINKKYGVVYTPDTLANFVAGLMCSFMDNTQHTQSTILDPACGECALLRAVKCKCGEQSRYVGIDIDKDAIDNSNGLFEIVHNDAILPVDLHGDPESYWNKKIGEVDAIIANPPWSSERVYEKNRLLKAGYTLVDGQYDSYVLFFELAYKLLRNGGVMGFIIPDSVFDSQNEELRRFLANRMQILVIARLGEKIFDEVNRATTIIVCKKALPDSESETECFRLSTDERKMYLEGKGTLDSFYETGKHRVRQLRFQHNDSCRFDIDTHSEEETIVRKITGNTICWKDLFTFGRGVEISKGGDIVYCPICKQAQGYSKKQFQDGMKKCAYCDAVIPINASTVEKVIKRTKSAGSRGIFVGENVQRYGTHGKFYIKTGIQGINYKESELYSPPKMLIRKTGLGIYATVDYSGSYTSQTVYILKYASENAVPLEYFLALVNSRVVYYFYLKTYGENEWKSHPYLTKQIIFSLPLRPYNGSKIDEKIVELSRSLLQKYDYETDVRLEILVMKKYGLNKQECDLIVNEMNKLPNLSAINNMKMEAK